MRRFCIAASLAAVALAHPQAQEAITQGAGGSVVSYDCTTYTESICRITVSLMNRGRVIQTPEFPPAP